MPKKNSPVRSKKFDHPGDLAAGYAKTAELKTPKHPKKTDKRPMKKPEVKSGMKVAATEPMARPPR